MNKEQRVNNLIQNGGFVEADRAWLTGLDDASLSRLETYSTAQIEAVQTAVQSALQQHESDADAEDEPETIDEYIANAPAAFQPILKAGVAAFNTARERAINTITANEKSGFTKEELAEFPLPTLERLAKLAVAAAPAANGKKDGKNGVQNADYSGNAPVDNGAANGDHVEEPLPTPVMNWETPSKK